MLLKNLVLSLLASKVLASPLRVTIDIEEVQDLTSIHVSTNEYPYEDVIEGLDAQTGVVELLTNAVLTLDDSGEKGMEEAILGLRDYAQGLFHLIKELPKDAFGEGETTYIEKAFKRTTESMVVLAESVYGYNETIMGLDSKGKFSQRYSEGRSAFGQYYSSLSKLLYECDADEKLNGCTGVTPFNKEYAEVMNITKTAMRSIRVSKAELYAQVDL